MKYQKSIPRKKNLSDATIDLCYWFIKQTHWKKNQGFNARCIHISDCIACGTISPMEGYEIKEQLEKLGYLPEWPDVRESNYSHTIRA